MPPIPLRLLTRFAIAAALVLSSPLVQAQTIQLPSLLYRQQPIRSVGQQPHWVNRADCLAQDVISFPLYLTGYSSYTLQVWAADPGVDCGPAIERQPGGGAQCWLLYSQPATTQKPTVTISAVDLVARTLPSSTGTTATSLIVPHGVYPDACNSATAPAGQALQLYFMYVLDGTTTYGTTQIWKDIGYDISPPTAPSAVSGAPGETRIHLNWTDALDNDIVSYLFYCDPPPGALLPDAGLSSTNFGPSLGLFAAPDAGLLTSSGGSTGTGGLAGTGGVVVSTGGVASISMGGAVTAAGGTTTVSTGGSGGSGGTGGTAGTGGIDTSDGGAGGTTVGASCSTTSKIQPGEDPVAPNASLSSYICGGVTGKIANEGTAEHLVNYHQYVIGIAAVDLVGNVGVLSQTVCETPVEVTDFFELYRKAGGKAGGGICSMSRVHGPAAGLLSAAGALALAFAARRSRRRRK